MTLKWWGPTGTRTHSARLFWLQSQRITPLRHNTFNVPPGARAKSQMTAAECKRTKTVTNLRIHVERAINRIKEFKLLKNIMPMNILPLADDIIKVCAALCNTQLPLVKNTRKNRKWILNWKTFWASYPFYYLNFFHIEGVLSHSMHTYFYAVYKIWRKKNIFVRVHDWPGRPFLDANRCFVRETPSHYVNVYYVNEPKIIYSVPCKNFLIIDTLVVICDQLQR